MRQLLFYILLVTFFVACDENSENPILNQPDLTEIGIKARPCEMLEYVGEIGNDFDSALDSLRKLKSIFSDIINVPLEVLFDYDNRQFYGIAYGDCGLYTDVLDTKGNYYLRSWYCPDENESKIEEEAIFENNKIFTIQSCTKIIYENRIGNDFDSALDSLKIMYEQTLEHYGEDGYYVEKEKIDVIFCHDNRDFFLLTFIDKTNIHNLILTSIVIDEKGNLFYVRYCED